MPLTKKGAKIKSAMDSEYGKKKGDQVFYASINKGKVTGAEKGRAAKKKSSGGMKKKKSSGSDCS